MLLHLACNSVSLSSNDSADKPAHENKYAMEEHKELGTLTSKKEELPKYLFTTKLSLGLKDSTFALLKEEIEKQAHCIINGGTNPELEAKRLNIVGDSLTVVEVFRKIQDEVPELEFCFAGSYVGIRYKKGFEDSLRKVSDDEFLNKKISVSVQEMPINDVFKELRHSGCTINYFTDIFGPDETLSLDCKNMPVKDVLKLIEEKVSGIKFRIAWGVAVIDNRTGLANF